jgi:hypothetical protein
MFRPAGLLLGALFSIAASAETVTITSPVPTAGQLITNGCIQVYALAESDAGTAIAGWRIYVDNISTSFRANNTPRINVRVCVPEVSTGNHRVLVRAWSKTGAYGSSTAVNVNISSAYQIVAPNDEALSPVAGQAFNNGLIRVCTSAYSPYRLEQWVVYIDGQIAFTSYEHAIEVKKDLEVPLGTHTVAVKVTDVQGRIATYTAGDVLVTKDPMNIQPFVTPPSSAVTLPNLDDQGALHWKAPITGAAASCRAGDLVCMARSPVAVMNPVQYVSVPPLPVASDGMGSLFQTLPGTEPWGNALYGTAVFDNDPSRVNFVSDLWVMPTTTNIQAIELDLYATVNGTTFMMGAQCDFGSAHWDFWDDGGAPGAKAHWHRVSPTPGNNDLVCDLQPNQWAHVRINMSHDATTYSFTSIEVNGVNHSLSELPAAVPQPRGWGNGTAIQMQIDANATATPYGVYVDNWNVTKW